MTSVAHTEYGMTTKVYKDIINSGYLSNMFDIQRQSGVIFSFNELDSGFVDKMLRITWAGRNYSDSIWNNTTGLADTLKTEFMVNYLTGRSDRDMAKVLDERFGVGSFNARRLVRTESAFFENEIEAISYEESDIERYEYLAILDERTSDMCARLDNKTFKVSERKPGINYPPLHAFCRSTTVAVFDDDWEAKIQDRVVSDVDSNRMTYDEWKNNPDIILKRKKNRNFTYDQEQYKRYKSTIGKGNVPKTFADFQEMKYNDGDMWNSLKSTYRDVNGMKESFDNFQKVSKSSEIKKLPIDSKPNSVKDFYVDGKLSQRRYYGVNGKPRKDIDYSDHGNPKLHKEVPHVHDWTTYERNKEEIISRQKNRPKNLAEIIVDEWRDKK